jgi:UMF1 family MFS transporter
MPKPVPERNQRPSSVETDSRINWRAIVAWCSYDWANSSFPTVITTFIFSVYFSQMVAPTPIEGTVLWSRALAVAGLIVAVFSPLIGAIADCSGPRKPWLFVCSLMCVFTTATLWFVQPASQFVLGALVLYVISSISYQFAIIFYDAMLKSIAPHRMLGRVSGWGWAAGYLGGLLCLVLSLWVVESGGHDILCLDKANAEPIRATTLIVALWFALFSVPLFLLLPDRPSLDVTLWAATGAGLKRLPATFKILRHNTSIMRFLIAHMFYTDGLVTLFAFGGIYAAAEFDITPPKILMFGIVLNVAAGVGASAFAWLDDLIGSKNTIMLALAGLVLSSTGLLIAKATWLFWFLAIILGVFVGPAQAAGRSLMARLAPEGIETEMFGLYALAGKATAFAGPLLLGLVVHWSGSQRAGMTIIIAFLLCGLIILSSVREPTPSG